MANDFVMSGIVLTLVLAPILTIAYPQVAEVFEYDNCKGKSIRLVTNVPDLSKVNWNNRIRSAKVQGLWFFYINPYYNAAEGEFWVQYGGTKSPSCFNFSSNMKNQASSVQYVGNSQNLHSPTVTLFNQNEFQGPGNLISADTPVVFQSSKSLIITGTKPWTFYDEFYFQGHPICLYPPIYTNYPAGKIKDLSASPWSIPHGSIKSIQVNVCNGPIFHLPSISEHLRNNTKLGNPEHLHKATTTA